MQIVTAAMKLKEKTKDSQWLFCLVVCLLLRKICNGKSDNSGKNNEYIYYFIQLDLLFPDGHTWCVLTL